MRFKPYLNDMENIKFTKPHRGNLSYYILRLKLPDFMERVKFKKEKSKLFRLKMAIAYVLINVESGSENEVLDELIVINEVKEAYFVYGVYDIIVKVVAENIDKLREVITWKIRRLEKVKSTVTMIAIMEAIRRSV